jgi:hypothetical protein
MPDDAAVANITDFREINLKATSTDPLSPPPPACFQSNLEAKGSPLLE